MPYFLLCLVISCLQTRWELHNKENGRKKNKQFSLSQPSINLSPTYFSPLHPDCEVVPPWCQNCLSVCADLLSLSIHPLSLPRAGGWSICCLRFLPPVLSPVSGWAHQSCRLTRSFLSPRCSSLLCSPSVASWVLLFLLAVSGLFLLSTILPIPHTHFWVCFSSFFIFPVSQVIVSQFLCEKQDFTVLRACLSDVFKHCLLRAHQAKHAFPAF